MDFPLNFSHRETDRHLAVCTRVSFTVLVTTGSAFKESEKRGVKVKEEQIQ
jgi:hypothetical protein